ncbi:MAG: hypothetical protein AAF542_25820 [Pseudomonadota bacterium]
MKLPIPFMFLLLIAAESYAVEKIDIKFHSSPDYGSDIDSAFLYGLASSVELARRFDQELTYCLEGKQLPTIENLANAVNLMHAGKTVTSEELADGLLHMLNSAFPCDRDAFTIYPHRRKSSGDWKPEISFQLEDFSFLESMAYFSGLSTGLGSIADLSTTPCYVGVTMTQREMIALTNQTHGTSKIGLSDVLRTIEKHRKAGRSNE